MSDRVREASMYRWLGSYNEVSHRFRWSRQRITYVGNANGRSRVGHVGRYCVWWMCGTAKGVVDDRLATQDRPQFSETTVERAGGTTGITRQEQDGLVCAWSRSLVSFPCAEEATTREPVHTPAEPFCGEAAEASDKPTFAASKLEKMLEVATETLTR